MSFCSRNPAPTPARSSTAWCAAESAFPRPSPMATAPICGTRFPRLCRQDPESEVVAAYIEGVQDGRAFFDALKRCARVKAGRDPQRGRTRPDPTPPTPIPDLWPDPSRCSTPPAVRPVRRGRRPWTNCTIWWWPPQPVPGSLHRPGGRLFGGGGGGFAVLSADAIDREGLIVPKLPPARVEKMREYIPVAGSSVNNPIDAFPPEEHLEEHAPTGGDAEGIDMVFMSPMTGFRRPTGKTGPHRPIRKKPAKASHENRDQGRRPDAQPRRGYRHTGDRCLAQLAAWRA